MPKHFELPDPNDRTVNSPLVLLSEELVLGLCNLHAQLKEIKGQLPRPERTEL